MGQLLEVDEDPGHKSICIFEPDVKECLTNNPRVHKLGAGQERKQVNYQRGICSRC